MLIQQFPISLAGILAAAIGVISRAGGGFLRLTVILNALVTSAVQRPDVGGMRCPHAILLYPVRNPGSAGSQRSVVHAPCRSSARTVSSFSPPAPAFSSANAPGAPNLKVFSAQLLHHLATPQVLPGFREQRLYPVAQPPGSRCR